MIKIEGEGNRVGDILVRQRGLAYVIVMSPRVEIARIMRVVQSVLAMLFVTDVCISFEILYLF